MDDQDVRIFCEMAFREGSYNTLADRHPSLSGIGRRLGLDEKTIRSRVRHMEKDGFIRYYQAAPSLALFGLESVGLYRFETVNLATKQKVLADTDHLPHVLETSDYLGLTVDVRFAGESADVTRSAAETLALKFELTVRPLGTYPIDPAPLEPDRLDWRIIQRLRYDARCTTTALARSLSITARMAEYRMAKLLNSRALDIRAVINAHRQQGLVFYELEIVLDEAFRSKVMARLQEDFQTKFWSAQQPASGALMANLFGFSLGEPESAALAVLQFPGVRRCSVFIQKEAGEPKRPNWIDDRIRDRLDALSAGDRPPTVRRSRVRPS